MNISGNLMKMKTSLEDTVEYSLPLGEELVGMNQFLGKKISLKFDGQINCIATGEKIKKSYNQGYSYKAFQTLAECDICIVKPELCHYAKGTCRDPKWGEEHCFQPHIVYLALSSNVKVGITRKRQVPTRWIDQGATQALAILEVKDRKTAGLIEVEIAKEFSDRTDWRKMLKGELDEGDFDLPFLRDQVFETFGDVIDDFSADDLESDIVSINYPILELPKKVTSLSFDKKPLIEGTLQGIKGQYLILDTGVLNMRKHQGYFIEFSA
tara:strand:+ start:106206 stop:107009 length:804 start_codon:yes stop_codon:yes gene_type:complete